MTDLPFMMAQVWEEAYEQGYADRSIGAPPTRTNPHKDHNDTPPQN